MGVPEPGPGENSRRACPSKGGRWCIGDDLVNTKVLHASNEVGYQEAPVYLVAKKLGEMLQINIEKYFRLKS